MLAHPWLFKGFPVVFFHSFPHVLLCRCHGFFNVALSMVFTGFLIAFFTDFPVVFFMVFHMFSRCLFYGFPRLFTLPLLRFSTCFYVLHGFSQDFTFLSPWFATGFLLHFSRSTTIFPFSFSMVFHRFLRLPFSRFSRCHFQGFPQVFLSIFHGLSQVFQLPFPRFSTVVLKVAFSMVFTVYSPLFF